LFCCLEKCDKPLKTLAIIEGSCDYGLLIFHY
jgi:hypothetical protein